MQHHQNGSIKLLLVFTVIIIIGFVLWTYVWFDSARNYVHGSLANQMIEFRLRELKFIDGALSSLEAKDEVMAIKRIEALREIHQESLVAIKKGIDSESSWVDYFTIKPENMEKLRQYLKNRTFQINVNTEDGVSFETQKSP